MQLRPGQIEHRQARMDRRARVVGWAKVLLPLGAALLIAAMFLASRPTGDITDLFTAEELATLGAGLKLENPRLAGVTENDQPYELTAVSALPDGPMANRVSFETPAGQIETARRTIRATAEKGMIDRPAERLDLEGDVTIETSDGWRGETGQLTIDLGARTAKSPGPVRATGPNGELEAGSFRAEQRQADAPPRIWFENRVRVLFIPPREE